MFTHQWNTLFFVYRNLLENVFELYKDILKKLLMQKVNGAH
jgi:hypothetical protein